SRRSGSRRGRHCRRPGRTRARSGGARTPERRHTGARSDGDGSIRGGQQRAGVAQGRRTMKAMVEDLQALESRHVLQTYPRPPVTFVRGQGVRLFDAEGKEYLDLLSGIGVASLGHAHPGLADALADQARTLLHTSNLFYHPLQGQLAERLAHLSGLHRAFFCNSGAEAVEACLKFARRYWYTLGETRTEIIALEHSFHGRTVGAMSATFHRPH